MSDIFDEFLYQFNEYCNQFRYRADEEKKVKANPDVWNPIQVISLLSGFQEKYTQTLASGFTGICDASLLSQVGFYGTVALLTVYTITGDYNSALKLTQLIPLTSTPYLLAERIAVAKTCSSLDCVAICTTALVSVKSWLSACMKPHAPLRIY